jgi:hypothetical protein
VNRLARGAVSGATGATAWALAEPILRRAFRTTFSDVRFAGKLVTTGRLWPVVGVAAHTALGASLGVALTAAGLTTPFRALLGVEAENLAAWPGLAFAHRRLPGRWDGRTPLVTNGRVFAQGATARVLYAVGFGYAFERLG